MSYKKYNNLSSTTLFNFTNTFERLKENLISGIYCGDIYEKLPPFSRQPSGYIVPMVSFCDIPLGSMKEHLDSYGDYAIGISREYARTYNINPVWYIHKDNPIIKKMFKSENKKELSDNPILPFLKEFFGKHKYVNETIKQKKFYDEKEWRFIPQDEKYNAIFKIGNHDEGIKFANNKKRKRETRMALDFDKISYIIVSTSVEKENLFPVLKKIANKKKIKYEKLVSLILTSSQIRRDF